MYWPFRLCGRFFQVTSCQVTSFVDVTIFFNVTSFFSLQRFFSLQVVFLVASGFSFERFQVFSKVKRVLFSLQVFFFVTQGYVTLQAFQFQVTRCFIYKSTGLQASPQVTSFTGPEVLRLQVTSSRLLVFKVTRLQGYSFTKVYQQQSLPPQLPRHQSSPRHHVHHVTTFTTSERLPRQNVYHVTTFTTSPRLPRHRVTALPEFTRVHKSYSVTESTRVYRESRITESAESQSYCVTVLQRYRVYSVTVLQKCTKVYSVTVLQKCTKVYKIKKFKKV